MNISQSTANEIYKSMSVYFRTLSLGFLAFALIEPMRSPDEQFAPFVIIGLLMAFFTLGVAVYILAQVKETQND